MNSDANPHHPSLWPVNILAAMMFLIPAVGVPSQLILQDSLKAALFAIGTLVAAIFFVHQTRATNARIRWHSVLWLPILLMAYALGSTVWSHSYLGAAEAIRWLLIGLLAWLGLNSFSGGNATRVLWGLHGGTVCASVWVALQFWYGLDWLPQAAFPASTFANRNFFAEYAVCALPYSLWLWAQATPRRWAAPMALSIALIVAALLAAGTRSALIALLALVLATGIIGARFRKHLACRRWPMSVKLLAACALVGGILILVCLPSSSGLASAGSFGHSLLERTQLRTASLSNSKEYSEGSFSERVVMWKATARMAMAHPITGVGAGAWEVFIPLYQRADTTMEFDYFAHNDVFQLLSEYGFVVGGAFIAFLLAFGLKWASTTWLLTNEDGALRAFALSSLLALALVASAGFPLHLAPCCALLGIALGVLSASDARVPTMHHVYIGNAAIPPQCLHYASGVLAICLITTFVISLQAFHAENKLVSAILTSTKLANAVASHTPVDTKAHETALADVAAGISINPHYRKLTPLVADRLAAAGDLKNAVKIWRSVAGSRPHVAALWSNLALGYSQLGQHDDAWAALLQFKRLRPSRPENISLEIVLRRNAGDIEAALKIIREHFQNETFDFTIVQAGYETAMLAHDWPLAIQALELRNASWPQWASDSYYRLGTIYALPEVNSPEHALRAFRNGLNAAPDDQRTSYRSQVPTAFREHL